MKNNERREIIKLALIYSLPIFCSYIFLGIAYGIMMEEAGFGWIYSAFASFFVYTGAFQFVLITFLSTGASFITVIVTALLMNSRQTFYSLTFLEEFQKMGKKLPFMIFSLTDETYAVNCSLEMEPKKRREVMFFVALFSWWYWITGSILGGLIGKMLPFDMQGIDFCMTSLFVILFVNQWEKTKKHGPAMIGLGAGVACLILFGKSSFMLPALCFSSGVLLLLQNRFMEDRENEC